MVTYYDTSICNICSKIKLQFKPIGIVLFSSFVGKMATSRTIICVICEAQYITKHADQWFPEYDEGLCSECGNSFRKISKPSRVHGVISLENYHHLFQKSVITVNIMI
jgi:hypothetical protein